MSVQGEKTLQRKTFVPLENNPAVFAHLSEALGVEPSLRFHDVYSIDDPDILAFIPRPIHALIFTCHRNVYGKARDEEHEAMIEYDGSGPSEPVIWFRQTIGNACGLMAFLHTVSNGGAKQYIKAGSDLDKLLKDAVPMQPTERASLLYNSKELEAAHNAAAQMGDSRAPRSEEDCVNHYICFVKGDDGNVWELNGGMKGPVNRGALNEDEDMLSGKALELSVRDFMKHASSGDVDFSIVAIAPAQV